MLNQSWKKIILVFLTACGLLLYTASFAINTCPKDYPAGITINGNLWDDVQDNLQFPDYSNVPAVQNQIRWFQRHEGYLNYILKQSAPYVYYIYAQTLHRNMPAEVSLLPIIESGYNPFGFSNVGANGLWQMMPGTASGLGIKIDWWYDGRRDLVVSTDAALNYLAYLNDFFTSDWLLAIAAYNCGEGRVLKAIKYNKKHHKDVDFWHLHLPKQTSNYVSKLLALAAIIRDPDRYNINLLPINNAPYLEQVDVGSQIDLKQAAKLADIDIATMRLLNPGFRQWATDPDGPYNLMVPANKADAFKQRLDALPKNKRVTWREHTVSKNDSLLKIAHEYKTDVKIIKQVNNIKDDIIHPGKHLLIPVAFQGSLNSPLLRHRTTITEEKMPGPKRVVHVVKDGDTLWTLAEKYGVSVRELKFWNKMQKQPNLLHNQKILIWAPHHANLVLIRNYTYKVIPGDSLSVIAQRFSSTPAIISKTNHLKNNVIRTGQVLKIPTKLHCVAYKKYFVYTVKEGDNLGIIAHKFHTTVKDIKSWNNMHEIKYLHPGQSLRIPRHIIKKHKKIAKIAKITKTTTTKKKYVTYIVKEGENLKLIAHKFKVKTDDLKKWNDLEKAKYIHPGQKIKIY